MKGRVEIKNLDVGYIVTVFDETGGTPFDPDDDELKTIWACETWKAVLDVIEEWNNHNE